MKRFRLSQWLLLLLILLTVAFIFSRSTKTGMESTEESDAVEGILSAILPSDSTVTDFILTNLRKIAHFTEFGMLGILTALFTATLPLSGGRFAREGAFGFFVAFFDETIQIFSSRGPAITDVWIDVGGYCFYSLLTLFILSPLLLFRKCPLFCTRFDAWRMRHHS